MHPPRRKNSTERSSFASQLPLWIAWRREEAKPRQLTAEEENARIQAQQKELEDRLKLVGQSWADEGDEIDYSKDPFETYGGSPSLMECGRLEATSWDIAQNGESNVVSNSEAAVSQSAPNTLVQEFQPSVYEKEQILPYDPNASRQEGRTPALNSINRALDEGQWKKESPAEFSMELPSASSRQSDWRARPTSFMTEIRPRRPDYRPTTRIQQTESVVRNITVRLVADAEAEIVPVRLPRRD
ncbi:hypothetical protein PSACC_02630 [Paramicrosporidium saccamoebae]|uniref:Uncharacterized protein n=1 Tax=Paramicrosporidium saccamoebae TaxID=1246581 RepID=A0A2H9TIC8_9FUNG|nr:hypothetical protein PSACC_02630 [Paramicrosporidium saccamoebae]